MTSKRTNWMQASREVNNPAEYLQDLELNWHVESTAIKNPTTKTSTRWNILTRSDTGQELGVVRNSYLPLHNHAATSWLNANGIIPQYGGELTGGTRVYVAAAYEGEYELAGEVYQTYAIVATSHDGKGSFSCVPAAVRGETTLRLPLVELPRSRHGHGSGMPDPAVMVASIALYHKRFQALARELLARPCSDEAFTAVLDVLKPLPKNPGPMDTRKYSNGTKEHQRSLAHRSQLRALSAVRATREEIRQVWLGQPDEVRETAWGALLAVAEWNDRVRPLQGSDIERAGTFEERQLQRALLEKPDYVTKAYDHLRKAPAKPRKKRAA